MKKNISNLESFYNKNNIENIIFNLDKNFVKIMSVTDLCITRAVLQL